MDVRENRKGNHEWIIERNWQHWVHKTRWSKSLLYVFIDNYYLFSKHSAHFWL